MGTTPRPGGSSLEQPPIERVAPRASSRPRSPTEQSSYRPGFHVSRAISTAITNARVDITHVLLPLIGWLIDEHPQ
jgi:hypothetical protein